MTDLFIWRAFLALILTLFFAAAVAFCVVGYWAKRKYWADWLEDRERVRRMIAGERGE